MANSSHGGSTSHDDVLDSFLTTIESKLRGPFSSLDLSKAVSTAALRQIGAHSSNNNDSKDPAREYLENLASVMGRTNKVIQCRMLIGLLGLNDMRTSKKETIGSENDGNKTQYLTPEILRILEQTQEAPLYEDWVRTTSGLIEGVMFRTQDGNESGNTRESCRGKEAAKIIRETGTEVCETVERQIQNVGRQAPKTKKEKLSTESTSPKPTRSPTSAAAANKRDRGFTIEKVKASSPTKENEKLVPVKEEPSAPEGTGPIPPDLNACFAPYRYRLIPTPILNTIVPEFKSTFATSIGSSSSNNNNIGDSNCHFQINASASILQEDLRLEAQRAKEHRSSPSKHSDARMKKDPAAAAAVATGTAGKRSFPPGFRPAKVVPTSKPGMQKAGVRSAGASSGGSSLFMPKKKNPASLFNTTSKFRPQSTKTMLRRKGGGAQALMKSGASVSAGSAVLNKLGGGGGSSGTVARTRPGGRAGLGRTSRMKMIDANDEDTLTKLKTSTANANMSAAELRASKRKRILEKGRGIGTMGSGSAAVSSFANRTNKKQKVASSAKETKSEPQATTQADSAAPAQQQKQPQQNSQNTLESWQSLLRDRSNKMNGEDKMLVEQFFTATNAAERAALTRPSHQNGSVYKMKIHEQRGKDPATGQEIKETFYLELDYDTGASKQSKKVKRY